MSAANWLLRFGRESSKLREVIAKFAEFLANGYPPWASYRALLSNRLIAIDKCPGTRPVGCGEIWRRLLAKCVLAVSVDEATLKCGSDQLAGGLEAGIEGAIHALREMWDTMAGGVDGWGVLLVDARNAFNEINRKVMLWVARHYWPGGARFSFNCYRHWAQLVLRGTGEHVLSKEGVTQGDPLAMVLYGIGLLPLVHSLRHFQSSRCRQSWYADDSGFAGEFERMKEWLDWLMERGPTYGYHPEPDKSKLIVHPSHKEEAIRLFGPLQVKVVKGARYLGGFIGDEGLEWEFIAEKTEFWAEAVEKLATAAKLDPQAAFAGFSKSLQCEWAFIHRVTSGLEVLFEDIEDAICDSFLPAIFGCKTLSQHIRRLVSLPIKMGGMGIPLATEMASTNFSTSAMMASHLKTALKGEGLFNMGSHKSSIATGRLSAQKEADQRHTLLLNTELTGKGDDYCRLIKRGGECGQWIGTLPTSFNHTILSPEEFRDGINFRYGFEPPGLPTQCDGCGKGGGLRHALGCKLGGLVPSRHSEARDELALLASQALSPTAVRDEPRIPNTRLQEAEGEGTDEVITSKKTQNGPSLERGDIAIRGFWRPQVTCYIDVRVTDVDASSYVSRPVSKVLAGQEKDKKNKYLRSCLDSRCHFTPFVCSVDGVLGVEASAFLKHLSRKLAAKWERRIAEVSGYVKMRMSLAIVRATNRCIRGARSPVGRMAYPIGDDGASLGLYKV